MPRSAMASAATRLLGVERNGPSPTSPPLPCLPTHPDGQERAGVGVWRSTHGHHPRRGLLVVPLSESDASSPSSYAT